MPLLIYKIGRKKKVFSILMYLAISDLSFSKPKIFRPRMFPIVFTSKIISIDGFITAS